MVAQGRVRSVAVGVSGLVATVSAAVGLWVTLFSGGDTQTAATPVGGSLLERDLLDQVTLGRYLRENGMPAGKYTSAQRSLQGAEALLQVRLTGLTGRPSLFWTLFHLAPRTPLGGSFDHQNGGEVPALSGTFEGIAKVWLPLPNKPGVYRARIELEYKGATLDFVDSRRIGVIQPFTPPVVGGSEHLIEPAPAPPVPIPHAAAVFTAVPPSPH